MGTGTAELRGCGVVDIHYHSGYSVSLFRFELEIVWDGMGNTSELGWRLGRG